MVPEANEALAGNAWANFFSDQLTTSPIKLFGDSGFEVGFEVDSYTNGQGWANLKTELKSVLQQTPLMKSLEPCRLVASFDVEGKFTDSQDAGAILGNVEHWITLTEDW